MKALARIGSVWVRGIGFLGQLGLNSKYANATEFTRIPSLQRLIIRDVAASWAQSAVLLEDGRLLVWGWPLDARSQMQVTWIYKDYPALAKFIQSYSPVPRISMREGSELPEEQGGFLGHVKSFDFGGAFMSANDGEPYTEQGRAYAWGMNHRGQCGQGHLQYVREPTPLIDLIDAKIVQVANGYQHSMFLTAEGKVWGTGRVEYANFGFVPVERMSPFVSIDRVTQINVSDITQIAAGQNHSLFLTRQGDVLACGKNDYGQCGQTSFTKVVENPTKVYLPEPVVKVSCGHKHSLVLGASGAVYAFGSKVYGQLDSIKGRGELEQCSPMKVSLPSTSRVLSISANFERSSAITDLGECWVWGGEDMSRLGGEHYQGFTLLNEAFPDDSGTGIMHVGLGYMHTVVVTEA
jgi:alpha-tubulin suppressor-like RCC1 family protein